MKTPITTGHPTVAPYSPGYAANGFIFTSGQVPIDPLTNTIVGATIEEQTERAMQNLKIVLAHGGVGMDRVIKTTCFLKNMSDFAAFNAVYATYFPENPPARSCFAVADLPLGAMVEIEAIALQQSTIK